MYVSRIIVRAVFAYFLGGAATVALFLATAFATGELAAGIHSNAAVVLLAAPVAWAIAFRWLTRVNVPPTRSAQPQERQQQIQ
jgi:hypothetical protein